MKRSYQENKEVRSQKNTTHFFIDLPTSLWIGFKNRKAKIYIIESMKEDLLFNES